jgi:hypothetical protein
MRYLAVVLAALLLSACGTRPFKPSEYPLRDGLIAAFPVNGNVAVTNDQPSTTQSIVYSYGGTKLGSTLKDITEVMTQQTQKELLKAGQPVRAGAAKSIALKVDVLLSEYVFFSWKSHIEFQAKLGNGQVLNFNVRHASGILAQDLNGCIAEGVMTLLNDPRVKTYLAATT